MRIWDVCVVAVVVVTVDSIEIGNSGRVKGNDCRGANADGRRWSAVVCGGLLVLRACAIYKLWDRLS
jgi:hypothetical protein